MTTDVTPALAPEDLSSLRMAYEALEHPSYAAKLGNMLGVPLEEAVKLLPNRWQGRLNAAAEAAIGRAARVAISSLGERAGSPRPRTVTHRAMAVGSGAAGGYFGLGGLLVELPVTTVIFLRAIADIAASHGEDPRSPETRLACVGVFAFGGRSHEDDYAEIGYYEVRSALALQFSTILDRMMGRGAETLPATVEVIRLIASRFGIVVTDKAAAQLVPIVGAAAGAAVNALFMQHFQRVADGHFTLRRLERVYGERTIESVYMSLVKEETTPRYRMRPQGAAAV